MRFGFLIGFLMGAGIASLFSSSETAEPGDAVVAEGPAGIVGKLKQQAADARAAARKASEEKQAEMLRDWEQSRQSSN
jgi:hypothetical protein